MNEAMKIKNIEKAMEPLEIPIKENFVYGYTEPGLLSSLTYGAFSSLVDMEHFLLIFTKKEVVLIGLTLMGDFSDSYIRIPRKDIELFHVKKGLIQYKLQMKMNGEKKITIKANKMIAAAKWQKANLAFLTSVNWYQW